LVNVDLFEYLIKSVLLEPEIGTLWTDCAAMTFYLNKLSRDDIECGKVRYHCSPIFACVFANRCTMLWERCKIMDLQPGKFQTVLFIELGFWFGKGRVENPEFSVSNRGSDYK
jgi:hypothetical protein